MFRLKGAPETQPLLDPTEFAYWLSLCAQHRAQVQAQFIDGNQREGTLQRPSFKQVLLVNPSGQFPVLERSGGSVEVLYVDSVSVRRVPNPEIKGKLRYYLSHWMMRPPLCYVAAGLRKIGPIDLTVPPSWRRDDTCCWLLVGPDGKDRTPPGPQIDSQEQSVQHGTQPDGVEQTAQQTRQDMPDLIVDAPIDSTKEGPRVGV